MAIVKYRTVHTGAKSQFGGRQVGFANRSYQSPGRNSAPVRAAKKQAAMKPRSTNTEEMSMTSLIIRVCSKSPISAVELIYVKEELPTYGLVIPMSALSH
jgi:hypothetical protein